MWCVVTHCIRCFPKLKETTHSFGIPARHITPFFLWSQEAGRGSVAELSRLPARPWCQGGHCTPCPAHSFVGSYHNPVMGVCMSSATTGPNCRVLVLYLHGVNVACGSVCAHNTSWMCQIQEQIPPQVCVPQRGEGAQRGPSRGWSKWGTGCSWQQRGWGVEGAPVPTWVTARRPPKGARAAPWLACMWLSRLCSSSNSIRTVTS